MAFGRDGTSHKSVNTAAAISPTAAKAAGSATSPSRTSSTSSSSAPAPKTTTSDPTPSSTVTGKVSKGVHSGDIRYFLLPAPSDGKVIGPADGDTLTDKAMADRYTNSAEALKGLKDLGFKDGAARAYQTDDAKYHVAVFLMHFSSAQNAKWWLAGDEGDASWKAFDVPGHSDVKAWDIPAEDSSRDEGQLRAVGVRGDVYFEVTIVGEPPMDHAVLINCVRKQIDRLDTGS